MKVNPSPIYCRCHFVEALLPSVSCCQSNHMGNCTSKTVDTMQKHTDSNTKWPRHFFLFLSYFPITKNQSNNINTSKLHQKKNSIFPFFLSYFLAPKNTKKQQHTHTCRLHDVKSTHSFSSYNFFTTKKLPQCKHTLIATRKIHGILSLVILKQHLRHWKTNTQRLQQEPFHSTSLTWV